MEFVKGDRVKVRVGAVIRSTHPKQKERICKRAYTITVFDFSPAYTWKGWHEIEQTRAAEITWPGTGGYWCRVAASDVEKV